MSHKYRVAVDQVVLSDFREELELAHQNIEHLAIALENATQDHALLQTLHGAFHTLWISSVKLDLVPLSEGLSDTLQVLELMQTRQTFPPRMSDFILLLIDRLLMLANEVERNLFIDIRKTQHLLVALQLIVLSQNADNLTPSIEDAITAITRDISDNLEEANNNDDIVLFDDDEDDDTAVIDETPVDLFIPDVSLNPLAQSREFLQHHFSEHPIRLIAEISDVNTSHGESHSCFLAELALTVNFLAGEPIDSKGLFQGICFHDVGLAAIPHILKKTGQLNDDELNEIRRHPLTGSTLVRQFSDSETAQFTVAQHHERLDGKGYPHGLKGDQISDPGKLVAIVDSFHAMIDQRPHRRYSKSTLRAMAEINACVDTQYDRHWIKLFNRCIREYWLPDRKIQSQSTTPPSPCYAKALTRLGQAIQ